MNRWVRWSLVLSALGAINGCQHPEDNRWSGRAEYVIGDEVKEALAEGRAAMHTDWGEPQVAVYAFATPAKAAAAAPSSIKDLSDHGQAALVQAMARPGTAGNLLQKVMTGSNAGTGSASGATPTTEPNRFDRTLVATVTKGLSARPGDRLMWTWLLVKPINFRFTGYTVLATETGTLDIEHIEHVTSTSLQGTLSATVPAGAATVNPSVTGSVTNQGTSSAEINQQYVKSGVDIVPGFLRIYRESERNLDVAGNTLISLSVVTDSDKYHDPATPVLVLRASNPSLSKNGRPLPPSEASLDIELVKSPPHCPLLAQVRLVYQLRRITGNERSYLEGAQRVSIEQHATPWTRATEIVSADDVQPALWQIFDNRRIPVEVRTRNREVLPLALSDYETARDVANWMTVTRAAAIGKPGLTLTLGGDPMPGPYPRLAAERVTDPPNQPEICAGTVYPISPSQ